MPEHAYTYHGKGQEFIAGVPARNLSRADVDALSPEARAEFGDHMQRHGGLYRKVDQGSGKRPRRGKVRDVSDEEKAAEDEQPEEDKELRATPENKELESHDDSAED